MRYNILNANEITTVGNLANRQVTGGNRFGEAEMLRSETPRSKRRQVQQPTSVPGPVALQPKPTWYHCRLDRCPTASWSGMSAAASRRWALSLLEQGRRLQTATFRFLTSSHLYCFDC